MNYNIEQINTQYHEQDNIFSLIDTMKKKCILEQLYDQKSNLINKSLKKQFPVPMNSRKFLATFSADENSSTDDFSDMLSH